LCDVAQTRWQCASARRAARCHARREHTAARPAFYERYERLTADIGRAAESGTDRGYELEL